MQNRRATYMIVGAIAGTALGLTQLRSQGYDFSNAQDISRAIGFLLGFGAFGVFVGWLSGRRKSDRTDDN